MLQHVTAKLCSDDQVVIQNVKNNFFCCVEAFPLQTALSPLPETKIRLYVLNDYLMIATQMGRNIM
jgi:hypothetical protein